MNELIEIYLELGYNREDAYKMAMRDLEPANHDIKIDEELEL